MDVGPGASHMDALCDVNQGVSSLHLSDVWDSKLRPGFSKVEAVAGGSGAVSSRGGRKHKRETSDSEADSGKRRERMEEVVEMAEHELGARAAKG